jgi:hypothetical protein
VITVDARQPRDVVQQEIRSRLSLPPLASPAASVRG